METDDPHADLVEPIRRVVRFMETLELGHLDGVFSGDAEIIDSFSPFIFSGREGVLSWARGYVAHIGEHIDLRASFGEAQEVGRMGDTAFISQPISWRYRLDAREVHETGGLAVVLRRQAGRWCIRRSAWAVVTNND
jgi:hypothetical protein